MAFFTCTFITDISISKTLMPIEYANNLRLFLYRNAQKNDNEFIADVKNKVHEAKEQLTEVKKTKAYVVKEGTITATKKTYCDSICTISMRMMNKTYTASLPMVKQSMELVTTVKVFFVGGENVYI